MFSAILLAAGSGSRLEAPVSKPLVKIGKYPVFLYSLRALIACPQIDEIIVVVNPANQRQITGIIRKSSFKKVKAVVLGGRRRQDSVYNGLHAVKESSRWVLIHDSARPFIERALISKVIRQAVKHGAAILAVRPKATIKLAAGFFVTRTLNRKKLWEVQTPQVFKKDLLLKAYKKYLHAPVTDDASLIEKLGKQVNIVPGSYGNIKITTSEDLFLAKLIVQRKIHAI